MSIMPRLPQPLTPESLLGLMRARPYWDTTHPRFPTYQRLVKRGFEILYPGPERRDDTGMIVDVKPLPPHQGAHLVEQTNREMDGAERVFDEKPSPGGEGMIHVQSHVRDGGKVEVADYWRAAPGQGADQSQDAAGNDSPRGATGAPRDEDVADHARARDPYPDSSLDFDFRDRLAKAEHSHDKADDGWGDHNKDADALGRYQLKEDSLKDAGFKERDTGEWTEKAHALGVRSTEDFLKNSYAQEKALEDSTAAKDRFLSANGAKAHLGQQVKGIEGEFEITAAGLAAAAHRRGAARTKEYLDHIEKHDWKSDPKTFPLGKEKQYREIETRLRTFERVSYRKEHDA